MKEFVNVLDRYVVSNKRYATNGEMYEKDDVTAFFSDCLNVVSNLEKNESYREKLLNALKDVANKENVVIFVDIDKDNYFCEFEEYKTMTWEDLCLDFKFSFVVFEYNDYVNKVLNLEKETPEEKYLYEISNCVLNWIDCVKTLSKGIPVVYSFNGHQKCVSNIPIPSTFEQEVKKPKPKPKKQLEQDLELELMVWLHDNGINAEKQTKVGNYRTDIWIPGVCFIELKRGKVTAKDFCQALRYNVETDCKIILVGADVEKDVVATINTYNNLSGCEKIIFVPWDTTKTYLRGLLGI